MNAEQQRLPLLAWKKWGSYVSDRQWGTVREDYSANGDAWNYTTHDMARSLAWRWGEEGIAGISDDRQLLCFSLALWNKRDPCIKERFFGLTNKEGNHGEDVKEIYYYLDATPTHSYMKMLYKYPQQEFPYEWLVRENGRRNRHDEEFELIDTGIFNEDKYFDVFVEYVKADPNDILIQITVHNRGGEAASLHVLPTVWFRNTWCWGRQEYTPSLYQNDDNCIGIEHRDIEMAHLYYEGAGTPLYCENETNTARLYNYDNKKPYYKDGINDHIVHGKPTVNPAREGTKAAIDCEVSIPARGSQTFRLRLCAGPQKNPFLHFDHLFDARIKEANEYFAHLQNDVKDEEEKRIHRQAVAGMLWNKQFYSYKVQQWLDGDPAMPSPPSERLKGRNADWKQVNNEHILSVPDKWEFPWYAAWDLGFHCVTIGMVDPDFAKHQLQLLTEEWYMHPSGMLPAYEWSLGDANPPIHAGAVYRVFRQDARAKGAKDYEFLESLFHKLLINFTWWVNRKDRAGSNIFEGGFLGLDNIGVFDRSAPLPEGVTAEQADATSWMAMYALNMLHISLELATHNKSYTGMATKFFEHFLYIAGAMASMGKGHTGLWDEDDEFFYDQVRMQGKGIVKMKVKSMVGLIPLFAVEVITEETLKNNPVFAERMQWFLDHRPDLALLVSRWFEEGKGDVHLLSLLRGHRMKRLLARMLDETEFLSDYGIRSLSKRYGEQPYCINLNGAEMFVKYVPGESDSDMYGGNSNWRGPIWMPMNFLLIESLRKYHFYYSDDFRIEYPTGSGHYLTLKEVGTELAKRLLNVFLPDEQGRRPVFGNHEKMQTDPHFKDYLLFHEYFHGDNGKGLGASHQTGWTGLVANLIIMKSNP
ncbi:glucosidase [Paraflavitalea sp. CAU 1676]|uniref:MGH1-like glycoside hydrolase domain-containing protein n=1 Tax=Paraflavitalea sp. CAU 1676 TaxID=3032598 RepID=UPI0023DA7B49|nr:glucosidase [Paraflavitalea sp. CAU 1676]MDF2192439.1 glucosidase [Paraflavitalea sp. CAU 1676]